MKQDVQALHLADECINAELLAGDPCGRAKSCAIGRMIDRPHDLFRQGFGIPFGYDHRVVVTGQDVEQTVRIGRDNGFPHRKGFERGDRCPFPKRRKDAEVEGRERGGHIPPEPHDSWVVGDQPYVSLHFMGAEHYAAK